MRFDVGALLIVAISTLASCGGNDNTSLVVTNEQGDGDQLDITNVLIQDCITRYWEPNALQFDNTRSMADQGPITIAHGESHTFELTPGCHDVLVARANGSGDEKARFASARVVLEAGQTATWVPWRLNENESWWCYDDEESCE